MAGNRGAGLDLWRSSDLVRWHESLDQYEAVVEAQQINGLSESDRWFREELPSAIAARLPAFIEHAELVGVTRWKMLRGEWRARNLLLVQSNTSMEVRSASEQAFALAPEPRAPVATLAKLAGVGPATASAVLSAFRGDLYPFLDEIVGQAIPDLGEPKFTVPYYLKYAAALRERAEALGSSWIAQTVGLALWSAAGGKAALP